jgi:hypothetical protein
MPSARWTGRVDEARSRRIAYDHEAFWIVVGTAAPVLLVSSIVAIGQALDLAADEGVAEQPVRSP